MEMTPDQRDTEIQRWSLIVYQLITAAEMNPHLLTPVLMNVVAYDIVSVSRNKEDVGEGAKMAGMLLSGSLQLAMARKELLKHAN